MQVYEYFFMFTKNNNMIQDGSRQDEGGKYALLRAARTGAHRHRKGAQKRAKALN